MRYIPNTPQDIGDMLASIGVDSIEALFEQIPEAGRLGRPLDIPAALCETDLVNHLQDLAAQNTVRGKTPPFIGGGVYNHISPSAVDHLLHRGEYFTAYTPYQAELSQGTLQVIFEFQTMVAELLGTEVANASLYDGSTGMSEGIMMARRITRRSEAIVSAAVHPEYREVAQTYNEGLATTLSEVKVGPDGTTPLEALKAAVTDDTACIVVQTPNYFGCLEDIPAIAEVAHEAGALLVVVNNEPTAFGIVEPPGLQGADIVVGEGQALGLPVNLGGPHCGLLGTRKKYIRQMPGRLCGRSRDATGRDGFVLTLSTREQHIRLEKSTSNICTNQGLMDLAGWIYLTLMGPTGMERVGHINLGLMHRFRNRLQETPGVRLAFPNTPVYNESVILTDDPVDEVIRRCSEAGVLPGISVAKAYTELGNALLVNITELHTAEDVDLLVQLLANG